MDLLLGDSMGGTWRDAVAHDLGALFGGSFSKNSPLVLAGTALVIGFIAAFGAFIGGIASVMITRLLHLLTKDQQE
jgi:hypothetical protein